MAAVPAHPGVSGPDVNVFEVGDTILVKHALDPRAFEEVRQYYDPITHRFEVPVEEFETLRAAFEAHSYRPVPVDVREFCVVTRPTLIGRVRRALGELFGAHLYDPIPAENGHEFRTWKDHGRNAREVVIERSVGRRTLRVLCDEEAVERAVAAGATPVSKTDIDLARVLE